MNFKTINNKIIIKITIKITMILEIINNNFLINFLKKLNNIKSKKTKIILVNYNLKILKNYKRLIN